MNNFEPINIKKGYRALNYTKTEFSDHICWITNQVNIPVGVQMTLPTVGSSVLPSMTSKTNFHPWCEQLKTEVSFPVHCKYLRHTSAIPEIPWKTGAANASSWPSWRQTTFASCWSQWSPQIGPQNPPNRISTRGCKLCESFALILAVEIKSDLIHVVTSLMFSY